MTTNPPATQYAKLDQRYHQHAKIFSRHSGGPSSAEINPKRTTAPKPRGDRGAAGSSWTVTGM